MGLHDLALFLQRYQLEYRGKYNARERHDIGLLSQDPYIYLVQESSKLIMKEICAIESCGIPIR